MSPVAVKVTGPRIPFASFVRSSALETEARVPSERPIASNITSAAAPVCTVKGSGERPSRFSRAAM